MPSISLPNFISKYLTKSTPKQSQRPGLGARGALGHAEIAPTLGYAFYLEQEVSIFSDVVLKLKQEMFRRGFFWEPKFALKCLDCDAEYDEEVEECDCGSRNLVEPDKNQINFFDNADSSFIESANYNHQSLKEVLTDFEFNLNVGDNAYLLLPKAYEFDNQGEIISTPPTDSLAVESGCVPSIETRGRAPQDITVRYAALYCRMRFTRQHTLRLLADHLQQVKNTIYVMKCFILRSTILRFCMDSHPS